MKSYYQNITDLNIGSTVALGEQLMTIQLGDLPSAEIAYKDLAAVIQDVANPKVLVTLLELDNVNVWDIPLDIDGMVDNMCAHFRSNDFKELADLLADNKETIVAMGIEQFVQHWDEILENLLYQRAAKAGKIKHPRQEKSFEQVLRKAHPLLHKKTQHPLAKHFVAHVWPGIHQDMRNNPSPS